jgi:hypothetical protein
MDLRSPEVSMVAWPPRPELHRFGVSVFGAEIRAMTCTWREAEWKLGVHISAVRRIRS